MKYFSNCLNKSSQFCFEISNFLIVLSIWWLRIWRCLQKEWWGSFSLNFECCWVFLFLCCEIKLEFKSVYLTSHCLHIFLLCSWNVNCLHHLWKYNTVCSHPSCPNILFCSGMVANILITPSDFNSSLAFFINRFYTTVDNCSSL